MPISFGLACCWRRQSRRKRRPPASGERRGRLAGRLIKMQGFNHEAKRRSCIRADKRAEFSQLLPLPVQHFAGHGRHLAEGFHRSCPDAQAVAAPSPPLSE